MSKTTIVFYNIINDKEDKNSQNVFYIPKPINSITLQDIRNGFPLVGTYHFRFKIIHNNNPAWVDISEESSPIPSLNSCIYAKVLRLSWMDHKQTKKAHDRKLLEEGVPKLCKNEKNIFDIKENKRDDHVQMSKTKGNIDMLLFESTPNKTMHVDVGNRKDGAKDQNYLDLMFN
ncbi:conserved Plasmodium protein, unknown function [Plasmodium knowlesi strain H]|uniref:DIX domain-containing protein n=3 Tax=Plasmodium knowlesi TaxID=5850 RepID=A0A5K1UL33_PLAKH|nr:DIX domain-containing protein, putative [Plasmodium knowlesi strain H]OTN67589.1 Uncharacterized protein PKNOH_S05380900 [Plasmodium knowlesi]CAA9990400.1 DIX domain-containing protein, putative [Plasmodium knowlesi strain H]SBO19606.1 conserved Plasmodium protein, unknown function [Plasmodium knowlesi strain H]SBO22615.1 conserved Plasmodium protein, unknown function [Plasmodium knowlesi strain H]VVS79874.1 DIX domain-containing protein, putative [Plasmodium knowlesi strain H]|eukprot:XP_002260800.1 hypothetical protein, conserved in Plasmodium species [Plasmodium knowlesi strain H]